MLLDVNRPEIDDLLVHAFNLDRAGRELGLNAFDNNLIREVIICRQAGLRKSLGRGETDALGRDGSTRYELKSTDLKFVRSAPMWPTSREVTATVLAAFRSMDFFLFAVFRGIDLLALFRASAGGLEPFFSELEEKVAAKQGAGRNLNNPKIPWRVIEPVAETLLLDPVLEGAVWTH